MYHSIEDILRLTSFPVSKDEIVHIQQKTFFSNHNSHCKTKFKTSINLPDANFLVNTLDHRTLHRKNEMWSGKKMRENLKRTAIHLALIFGLT